MYPLKKKKSYVMDFIAHCLHISSYFWGKCDTSWGWWQLQGKSTKGMTLSDLEEKQEGVLGAEEVGYPFLI